MTNSKHLIKKVAIISGLMLGGFAIAALAASWTPPTAQPPENNVDAPINVGSSPQGKVGRLGLGQAQPRVGAAVLDVLGAGVIDNLFANTFTLTSGSPENGKVLTATNNNGLATWTDLDDINDPIDSCDLIAESSVVLQHFEAVTIPASCLNGTCHLHMATYNSAGDVVSLKSASLVQFTDSAKTAKGTLAQWWAKSGAGAENGGDDNGSNHGGYNYIFIVWHKNKN